MDDDSLALVIIPAYKSSKTLGMAVDSALRQTHRRVIIEIIGDGVDDATRVVAREWASGHESVSFLDRPKSSSRAEAVRHERISATTADFVTYLGDDDVFFPDHVETMARLLKDHDFAHPFPIFVAPDDELVAFATDLSDPQCVQWHLRPGCNTISLSGAAHTTNLYRRLPTGWEPPPPGAWSDHHFWKQIFVQPDVRLATAPTCTTVKRPRSWPMSATEEDDRDWLAQWHSRVLDPEFRSQWDQSVIDATRRAAATNHMWVEIHHATIQRLEARIADLTNGTDRAFPSIDPAG